MKELKLPNIPDADRTPLVDALLNIIDRHSKIIEQQSKEIQALKDEIKDLKKHKKKPKIKPSKMDKNSDTDNKNESDKKRNGSKKRNKTSGLPINKTEIVKPDSIPSDSKFKGYNKFIVQDINIETFNTEYKLERWLSPDGKYITGKLPEHLKGRHFGPELISYILYQYHHQCVTQPLLFEQLKEWGVDISSGQLNKLLIDDKDIFHDEKDGLLSAGICSSKYIQVDDTGARHKGKNGYCTHIGNEFFAWFKSTNSKSRINFLELLRANATDYKVDKNALDYMKEHKLPSEPLKLLSNNKANFADKLSFGEYLKELGIIKKRHIKIATEGALVGSILSYISDKELLILSDDAGQFDIFNHALCWIHAERKINELIPMNPEHRAAIIGVRRFFWQYYNDLKEYKKSPAKETALCLTEQFDALFGMSTCFESLNQVLKRLHKNKDELLKVLKHPVLPLHNNSSESDIREYVKRRKISGSTRSDDGRRCRDTFASLKKTCKKLKIKFWDYLLDRIKKTDKIQSLPNLIIQANTS